MTNFSHEHSLHLSFISKCLFLFTSPQPFVVHSLSRKMMNKCLLTSCAPNCSIDSRIILKDRDNVMVYYIDVNLVFDHCIWVKILRDTKYVINLWIHMARKCMQMIILVHLKHVFLIPRLIVDFYPALGGSNENSEVYWCTGIVA